MMQREEKETELQYNKYILFLPNTAANITVRGELGKFSIYFFWKESILKYWCRVNAKNDTSNLKYGYYSLRRSYNRHA